VPGRMPLVINSLELPSNLLTQASWTRLSRSTCTRPRAPIRAFKHATGLLESNDRTDEASQLKRLGIVPGGHSADSWDLTELQRPRSRPLR
jgi:hypothetical protein